MSIVMSIVIAALVIPIPVVIVFNAAAVSLPVARVISFAIVARRNPTRSLVRWPSPIPFVPFVMPPHRIPITRHPHGFRSRAWRNNGNHPWWRRCPNHDSDRNLGFTCAGQDEQRREQQRRSDDIFHVARASLDILRASGKALESSAIRECERNTWSRVQVKTLSQVEVVVFSPEPQLRKTSVGALVRCRRPELLAQESLLRRPRRISFPAELPARGFSA